MALGNKHSVVMAVNNPVLNNLATFSSGGQLQDGGLTPSSVGVRPNLLVNWYFVGMGTGSKLPINQLCVTSSKDVDINEIFIDRWRIGALGGSVNVTVNGLVHSDSASANIFQKISVPAYLFGQTVTLSAWMQGKLVSGTVTIPTATAWPATTTVLRASTDDDIGLELILLIENGEKIVEFVAILKSSLTLKAVKMEIGKTQTLCTATSASSFFLLDIPNHTAELLKCQNHMVVLQNASENGSMPVGVGVAVSTTEAYIPVFLPIEMRTIPAIMTKGQFELATGLGAKNTTLALRSSNKANIIMLSATAEDLTPGNGVFLRSVSGDQTTKIIINANL